MIGAIGTNSIGVVSCSLDSETTSRKRLKSMESPKKNKDDWVDSKRVLIGKERHDNNEDVGGDDDDDDDDDEKTQCTICMCASLEVLFVPCGHICACTVCASKVETCPLCRTTIEGRHRAYIS